MALPFYRFVLVAISVALFFSCFAESYELNSTTMHIRFDGAAMIITPHIQLNQTHRIYYNLSLILIKERNSEGEILQSVSKFNGSWTEPSITATSQNSNFTHINNQNDDELDYDFTLVATVYETATDIPYGDLDFLSFNGGDLSFGFVLGNWPWQSVTNRITVRFRLSVWQGNQLIRGTDLIWKDDINPSGHINGINLVNDASLRVHFPILAISDEEKVYAGVGVDDIEYALELNFNFPHVSDHIFYCPSLGTTESRYEEYATVTLAVVLVIVAVVLIAFFFYKWYHRHDSASVISA